MNPPRSGYATTSFHVETFLMVLGTCMAITTAIYLLYTCAKEGSCLPKYFKRAAEGRMVRYWRNPSAPSPECGVSIYPDVVPQRMLSAGPPKTIYDHAGPQAIYEYDPPLHSFQQHGRSIYPRLDKREREARPSTATDCRDKGVPMGAAAAWDKM